jgi:hypothetical protein
MLNHPATMPKQRRAGKGYAREGGQRRETWLMQT